MMSIGYHLPTGNASGTGLFNCKKQPPGKSFRRLLFSEERKSAFDWAESDRTAAGSVVSYSHKAKYHTKQQEKGEIIMKNRQVNSSSVKT